MVRRQSLRRRGEASKPKATWGGVKIWGDVGKRQSLRRRAKASKPKATWGSVKAWGDVRRRQSVLCRRQGGGDAEAATSSTDCSRDSRPLDLLQHLLKEKMDEGIYPESQTTYSERRSCSLDRFDFAGNTGGNKPAQVTESWRMEATYAAGFGQGKIGLQCR